MKLLTSTVLAALLAGTARAQDDGIALDPPVPIAGDPWNAQVTAWALPPQTTSYLVQDVPRLTCPVTLVIQPDGAAVATAETCPETMRQAALTAAAMWTFSPVEASDQPSTAQIRFVVRYNAALGAMTLFAELDPGSDHPYEEGRPGLKLIRPATPTKALEFKLKGKQRKAGIEPANCSLRARVTADGRVTESLVVACPDALAKDAQARVAKARFLAGRVDGQVVEDVTDVVVRYY
ncbi:MAG: hypothetical protein GXP62_10685 [Oligoflexia bacterium]|nr:hypothetical protein [Oligoflexia bacterium]